MRLHQVIREGTPESHQEKGRTPTMGGLIVLTGTLIPTLLWAKLSNVYVLLAMVVIFLLLAANFQSLRLSRQLLPAPFARVVLHSVESGRLDP